MACSAWGPKSSPNPPRAGAGAALAAGGAGKVPGITGGAGAGIAGGVRGVGRPGITGRAERGAAPASPCAGGVFGLGDQVEDDVLVAPEGGDVQGAPAVAVGQADVGAELDQELDELQVAVDDGLVQSRLPLGPEGVDVELAVRHVLQ